jgi:hypothetical protein
MAPLNSDNGKFLAMDKRWPEPATTRTSPPTRASMTLEGGFLEAWAQGYNVGSLIILILIVFCNYRSGILLHKLILLEVRPALPMTRSCSDIQSSFSRSGTELLSSSTTHTMGGICHPPLPSSSSRTSSTTSSHGSKSGLFYHSGAPAFSSSHSSACSLSGSSRHGQTLPTSTNSIPGPESIFVRAPGKR